MWDIKLTLMDTENNVMVTRGKRVRGSKGGQIYDDRRLFDFGW